MLILQVHDSLPVNLLPAYVPGRRSSENYQKILPGQGVRLSPDLGYFEVIGLRLDEI